MKARTCAIHGMAETRSSVRARRTAALSLAALTLFVVQPPEAAEPGVTKIAVFDFELDDRSAGRGVVEQDPIDIVNLQESTEEARRILSASGHYSVVDTCSTATDARDHWQRTLAPISP
jgi:hypothetical protein